MVCLIAYQDTKVREYLEVLTDSYQPILSTDGRGKQAATVRMICGENRRGLPMATEQSIRCLSNQTSLDLPRHLATQKVEWQRAQTARPFVGGRTTRNSGQI